MFLEPKKGLDIRKADNLIDDKKNLNNETDDIKDQKNIINT